MLILILDARHGKVREDGAVRSQAVLIAIGINWEARRCVLAVELANRESGSTWKDLLLSLKRRGLIDSYRHTNGARMLPGGGARVAPGAYQISYTSGGVRSGGAITFTFIRIMAS